jgi:hypothetical protein
MLGSSVVALESKELLSRITWFTTKRSTLLSALRNTSAAPAQQRSATPQQIIILHAIQQCYLEASLLSASSISTLQVRELCLVSLQQLQCLSARTLFTGVSLSSHLLPSFSAIRVVTLPTVRVSSAYIYRFLRLLRFVNALTALCKQPISSCINTML